MYVDPAEIIAVAVFAPTAAICAIKLVFALARRLERGKPAELDSQADARLARIEQAVDTMALEVERIAEGQRYLTKVLAGSPPAGSLGAGRDRMGGDS